METSPCLFFFFFSYGLPLFYRVDCVLSPSKRVSSRSVSKDILKRGCGMNKRVYIRILEKEGSGMHSVSV